MHRLTKSAKLGSFAKFASHPFIVHINIVCQVQVLVCPRVGVPYFTKFLFSSMADCTQI